MISVISGMGSPVNKFVIYIFGLPFNKIVLSYHSQTYLIIHTVSTSTCNKWITNVAITAVTNWSLIVISVEARLAKCISATRVWIAQILWKMLFWRPQWFDMDKNGKNNRYYTQLHVKSIFVIAGQLNCLSSVLGGFIFLSCLKLAFVLEFKKD